MSDASDADRQEQEQPAVPDQEVDDVVAAVAAPGLEPEAPVADVIEQRLPVPGAEEDYEAP
ncbi:MAG: hypothetical protein ACLGI2_05110 [Acidimicrobiia bacterium]